MKTKDQNIYEDYPDLNDPFLHHKYLLPTPCIYELSEFIKMLMWRRVSGAIVVGRSGFGKTFAISYLSKEIKAHYGDNFPVHDFDFDDDINVQKDNVKREFFFQFLEGLGHSAKTSGRVPNLKQRVIKFLVKEAQTSGTYRIVIFIDEAQNLQAKHYRFFVRLDNILKKKDIIPLFILFGQPELAIRRATFIAQDQSQIVRRFMVDTFNFSGLKDADGIKVCLKGYDEAKFPGDPNKTITRYFFPNVSSEQWCLANESENAWSAFKSRRGGEALIEKDRGIPMMFFVWAVEHLLRKYQTDESRFPGFSIAQWKEAIDLSKYLLTVQCTIPQRDE